MVVSQDPRTAARSLSQYAKPASTLSVLRDPESAPQPTAQPSSPFTRRGSLAVRLAQSSRRSIEADGAGVCHEDRDPRRDTQSVVSADYSARKLTAHLHACFRLQPRRNPLVPPSMRHQEPRTASSAPYDVTPRLNPTTQTYAPLGGSVPMSPGSGNRRDRDGAHPMAGTCSSSARRAYSSSRRFDRELVARREGVARRAGSAWGDPALRSESRRLPLTVDPSMRVTR